MGFFKKLRETIGEGSEEGRAEALEEFAQESAKQEAGKKAGGAEYAAFIESLSDKERFWAIIDDARGGGGWEEMYDPLVRTLSELDTGDIMLWKQIFDEYYDLSHKEKLWAAAYVINGGCSDDGFDYFKGWLIAQGEDVFLSALRDPDSLATVESCDEDVEFELILGAPMDAYLKKNRQEDRDNERFYKLEADFYKELDAFPFPQTIKDEMTATIEYASDIDCEWDEEDEDSMKRLLPKLCEAFDW